MFQMPSSFELLWNELLHDFTRPSTARRVVWLLLVAVLVAGNRTVAQCVRLLSWFDAINPSTFHRVLSHRRWSPLRLSRIIIDFILQRYVPRGIDRICGDDTVDGHRCPSRKHRT